MPDLIHSECFGDFNSRRPPNNPTRQLLRKEEAEAGLDLGGRQPECSVTMSHCARNFAFCPQMELTGCLLPFPPEELRRTVYFMPSLWYPP